MERQEVYEILDKEREYQDEIWGGHKHDQYHNVGDFLTYIDYYLRKAKDNYTTKSGNNESLKELRKIIALGIACSEIHGLPEREL